MFKLRSLFPLSAIVAAASLFAQNAPPPPPRTPAKPPADPAAAEPKVNVPRGRRAPAATPAPASAAPAQAPKPKPRAGWVRVATPLPMDPNQKKASFWDKVLKRKTKVETTPKPATPTGTPTPQPRRVKPKKDKPAASTPEPSDKPAEPTDTPAPKPAPAPKATPAPKPPKSTKPSAPEKPAATDEGASPEETEDAKFKAAKDRAMADPEVQELRQKSDAALDPEEGRKAMRAYNKGLYRKMRSIDPSIKERIDAQEAAIMRKLGE